MADQGKWFKLWVSSLDDLDLENLSLEDWARWARLGAYIKKHGKDGCIRFRSPARALTNLFRMDSFEAAIELIKTFPNYVVGERETTVTTETSSTVTHEVECKNWFKYQGDFSGDRVRKFRDRLRHHVTAQEEKRSRRDVEEKRSKPPIVPKGTFDQVWQAYPKRIGRKAAERKFAATVKTPEDLTNIKLALRNYLASERVRNGYVQNGSTWFNNWQDWTTYREEKHGTHDRPGGVSVFALARAAKRAEGLRKTEATDGPLLAGVRNLPDVQPQNGPHTGHGNGTHREPAVAVREDPGADA